MCYSKLSSLLNSPSHDVRASCERSTKSGCKGSANRMKYQIYLSISEMPPTFRLRSRLKIVQTKRKQTTKQASASRHLQIPLHIEPNILRPHGTQLTSLHQLLEFLGGRIARTFTHRLKGATLHKLMHLEILR